MGTVRIPDPIGFEARMRDLLLEREAENHLMLGILGTLGRHPAAPGEKRFFWTVQDGSRVLGGALWTPPFKPVLARLAGPELAGLLDRMEEDAAPLNGASGPGGVAARFAELWSSRHGGEVRRVMGMRIRECREIAGLATPPGTFRQATTGDLESVLSWGRDFHASIGLNEPVEVAKELDEYLAERRLFVWVRAECPVSMAGWTGPTPNGARLNLVYTPPAERGKGYSKACVAGVCRWLFANGRRRVFLFADADNPVSNRVYDRVGFADVSDWDLYEFPPSPPPMG